MKQKFFQAITIVITCSFIVNPFAYTLSVIDPSKGAVKAKLEQFQASLQTKGKPSTTSSTYNINSGRSGVRIKIPEAVFQSSSDKNTLTMNPADYINLYKLNVSKSSCSFTINTDGSTNASLIPLVFTSLDYGFYKIAPANGLIPGEYAFIDKSTTTADGNIIVWTFGVD